MKSTDSLSTDQAPIPPAKPIIPRLLLVCLITSGLVGWLWPDSRERTPEPASVESAVKSQGTTGSQPAGEVADASQEATGPRVTNMEEMLAIALESLQHLVANVDNYSARLVKQEQDRTGVLQPASEMFLKVQTRHQNGTPGDPLKVYMRFDSPEEVKGREVIWVENQNEGNLLVREAGMLGGLMTLPLAPDNFLAMRGQRYPINEIGLTRLLEKLIERGEADLDDPHLSVLLDEAYLFEGQPHWRLVLKRDQPSGRPNDFSTAELILDPQRHVVVHFQSRAWPASDQEAEGELIESYTYRDLKLNLGLTDLDFDTNNPEYTFAK